MPRLDSKKLTLIQFATKLRNAIATFKAHNLTDHLRRPDLFRAVSDKLPDTLKYAYARNIPVNPTPNPESNISELEQLSKFLYSEAELTSKTAIFDFESLPKRTTDHRTNEKKHDSHRRRDGVYSVTNEDQDHASNRKPAIHLKYCLICKNGKHRHEECPRFTRERRDSRPVLVTKSELCYGCLYPGHFARVCRSTDKCRKCDYVHHEMLPCVNPRNKHENKRDKSKSAYKTSKGTDADTSKAPIEIR